MNTTNAAEFLATLSAPLALRGEGRSSREDVVKRIRAELAAGLKAGAFPAGTKFSVRDWVRVEIVAWQGAVFSDAYTAHLLDPQGTPAPEYRVDRLAPALRAAVELAEAIAARHNYDESRIEEDYFCVGYYLTVDARTVEAAAARGIELERNPALADLQDRARARPRPPSARRPPARSSARAARSRARASTRWAGSSRSPSAPRAARSRTTSAGWGGFRSRSRRNSRGRSRVCEIVRFSFPFPLTRGRARLRLVFMKNAIDTYNLEAAMAAIPADVRWANIRMGLAHSVQMSHFTLRTGAERRGSVFVPKAYTAHNADACDVGLFGRPE